MLRILLAFALSLSLGLAPCLADTDFDQLKKLLAEAKSGNAVMQVAVANMYYAGAGFPQDYGEAFKWYGAAADQGEAHGQWGLGKMYYEGVGVPQNYVLSHMWFNISASHAPTNDLRSLALQGRDAVARQMTAEQIAEAQKRAAQWKPRK